MMKREIHKLFLLIEGKTFNVRRVKYSSRASFEFFNWMSGRVVHLTAIKSLVWDLSALSFSNRLRVLSDYQDCHRFSEDIIVNSWPLSP